MRITALRILFALAALTLMAAACGGDDGSIEVQDARYRLARSDLGAGYLSISNTTDSDVTLMGASADGVGRIELHETSANDDGTMAMREMPNGFTVPAGETIELEPGGKHLMLFDPTGTDDLTFELDFGDETISVVASFDADASATMSLDDGDTDDGDMDDGDMDDTDG